jgi:hypothetical protein
MAFTPCQISNTYAQLIGVEFMQSPAADGEARYRIKQVPRDLGFDKGLYVCVRALQLLVQRNKGSIIVAVAGMHLLSLWRALPLALAVIQCAELVAGSKVTLQYFSSIVTTCASN